jgi:hypothetical protein
MLDSEVDEAECLGESMGDPIAVEGDEMSDSVVAVNVLRSAGFTASGVAVVEAIVIVLLANGSESVC